VGWDKAHHYQGKESLAHLQKNLTLEKQK